MYSLVILIISAIPSLIDKDKNIKNNLLNLLLTAVLLSYTFLGLISLILISIDQSRFPILIISLAFLTLTILKDKDFFCKYILVKNYLLDEIYNFNNLFKIRSNKIPLIIISGLVLLITISSIGPINHPDALDYHVGYIYQYWLKKGFYADKGLSQGLLGIGDYANLSFIQEGTIWLIRYIQIISLPLITLFLINSVRNKFFIIAFLSSPTFLQWSTIGKPLFLGEASAAIAYIFWKNNKDPFSRKLLILCLISCTSIKLSALIICFPIFIDMFTDIYQENKDNIFRNSLQSLKYYLYQKNVLLSIFTLICIFLSRYFITGNFAYPLLTKIFNKNDLYINQFADFLSNYQRDGFFPINIFIPFTSSDISTALGPPLLILLITLIIKELKKINLLKKSFQFQKSILLIGFFQVILLMLFCQGRSDYYAMPILLLVYSSNDFINFNKINIYKKLFKVSIYIELSLMFFLLFFSTYQNIAAAINYNKNIELTSYGYSVSKYMVNNLKGNVYQNLIREARFYYPENYITKEKFLNCLKENIVNPDNQEYCFNSLNIKKIISSPEFIIKKENYNCKNTNYFEGARNPLNRYKKSVEVEICNKI